ncbi:MAG TPA: hypothetical protein VGJ05_21445 [Fimbriiglobus sp.]
MWYTGLDPITKQSVKVQRNLKDRKYQRVFVQLFNPVKCVTPCKRGYRSRHRPGWKTARHRSQ